MSEDYTADRVKIFDDVLAERVRQDTLKAAGKFKYTCADFELLNSERLTILTEELGEVAREVLNHHGLSTDGRAPEIRRELVQVMAVSLAWIEHLDWTTGARHKQVSEPT